MWIDILVAMAQVKRIRCCLVACLTLLALTQCSLSESTIAPVHQAFPSKAAHGGTHRVGYGETLVTIAWTYGLDHQELAAINHLELPYTLQPGQRLYVDPQKASVASKSHLLKPKTEKKLAVELKPFIKPVLPQRLSQQWIWPAQGAVSEGFSANNRGIDIQGQQGDAILAANDGIVLYAGQHLRGYGKVILIQHSRDLVSAYAHNRQNLVAEGQTVRKGQRIAEMGKSESNQVKLHFEIREKGKPINPLRFFPH